ncbi:taste receptor type 1 member 2-like isoform X2 [Seriola dumerili]|uniref:taste receptor type 1 member 2-like isoform X2 n=1 Tax=Seriola dumerili TaxID=41447 RepID=UPI000BBEDB0B|nr:taste receptor type 1 member 2-like isoform X2 [Seriola dumerili]
MKHFLPSLCLLGFLLRALTQCPVHTSEFQLEGDYLIGGLFDVHHVDGPVYHDRPETIDCASENLTESSYRRFQLMRFSVEEINNSTNLLPNVSLGYEIFDHCSDIQNFPGILNLISVNGLIQPWGEPQKNLSSVSKVIAVVGTYTSTETLSVAPLFMMNLIPMAPTSVCSPECPVGHAKKQDGIHKCCFNCEICLNGTYVNSTEDPYKCIDCKETEWSAEGSTSCNLRVVEYTPFTDSEAILIMVGAWALVGLTLAMSVLFAINYNTPIVRSAGGPMCFLILGCLSLCSLSVFFYFDKPTVSFCILRLLPFILFYTVCLACFVVRSFQIVCVFKMAAKFPKLYSWWIKYHGQWLVITGAFVIQALFLLIGYSCGPPKPYNETRWYPDKIILSCDMGLKANSGSVILLLSLCSLCFIFSYMGKDLPKNYNEAKAITFCLLLLILTWIIFSTVHVLYRGKYIQTLNALAVLSSLFSFLLWYFLPKCYIIIFQPHKNTQQYFQGLIQNYTKTISQ